MCASAAPITLLYIINGFSRCRGRLNQSTPEGGYCDSVFPPNDRTPTLPTRIKTLLAATTGSTKKRHHNISILPRCWVMGLLRESTTINTTTVRIFVLTFANVLLLYITGRVCGKVMMMFRYISPPFHINNGWRPTTSCIAHLSISIISYYAYASCVLF